MSSSTLEIRRPVARPRLSRALAGCAAVLGGGALAAYAVLVGPVLVEVWTDSDPRIAMARFFFTAFTLLALMGGGGLLVGAALLRPAVDRSRDAQVAGAAVVGCIGVLVALCGYWFRGGLRSIGDPWGLVAMAVGLVLLAGAIAVAWPDRQQR